MIKKIFTKEIIKDGKTIQHFSPEVIKESICSDSTLAIIQDMLLGVVEKGTGKAVHSDIIRIAGKTGTAQIASGGVYRTSGHQVAFCGYFPADNPKYSCIVVIRRPRIGYPSGGTMSGGVVKAVAEKIYASYMLYDVREMERDSLAVPLPQVKGGNREAVESVLDELDIPTDADSLETIWTFARLSQDSTKIELRNLEIHDGTVPRVIGMGAKDAVYLMEKAGLRVSLSGVGRVVSQSVSPGGKVHKGQTVLLTLR